MAGNQSDFFSYVQSGGHFFKKYKPFQPGRVAQRLAAGWDPGARGPARVGAQAGCSPAGGEREAAGPRLAADSSLSPPL